MTREQWSVVDRYFTDLLVRPEAALGSALEASAAAELPPIQVSASFGKLLQLMARAQGAQAILEIGTLGGYSTIWLARALPAGGRLVTLELDPRHADVARASLKSAGLADTVEVRVGEGLAALAQLGAERAGPFDFVFIDADKERYADYFKAVLDLTRPGSLIVADNVVRRGEIVDGVSDDPRVMGIRRFNEAVAAEPRASATAIQTVGSKGHDGFALVLVNAGA